MHYSDPEAFAQRLNSCLHQARISQLELANRTGLKPSQINHFCCGRRLPNLRNFTKICRSLPGADPRFLMGLKEG
ncbi:helix-turn-helix domain-containing protein [Sedimenticola hydrogenitrophicus]|uniref:helix-turn-helix domain-containing protein n=1 Tax=Sedimenticola hydrogenitrophicus TaxID=2967975 RepID=UPI0023B080E1|nr:helix-turn-helix transcriptional regulator [Sedimenticola hydrogenitrophicus]